MSAAAKEKTILYLDVLGLASLVKLSQLSRQYEFEEIRYCRVSVALRLFKGLLPEKFKEFSYHMGEIFWKENESIFWLNYRELTPLSVSILERSGAGKLLVDSLHPRYNKDKIRLHLTQKISLEIDEVLQLILVARYGASSAKGLVLTRRLPWSTFMTEHAQQYSIPTGNYFHVDKWFTHFLVLFKFLAEALVNSLALPFFRLSPKTAAPAVGVCYLNGVDPQKRNDLFWFKSSELSAQNILIYFKSAAYTFTRELKEEIEKKGFRYVNFSFFSPRNPLSWLARKINVFPTPRFFSGIAAKIGEITRLSWQVFGKDAHVKIWQLHHLALLLNKVNFYEAFFSHFNVKVHFSLFGVGEDQAASNLAMDINGGVDIATHWSNFPMLILDQVSSHEIYFCWGPYHEKLFKDYPFVVKYFLHSGYMYASSFASLREKALKHREALHKQGVEFIVSFFDEQYEKIGWLSKSLLEEAYCALLRKVIEDKTFGLIIKTKKIATVMALKNQELTTLLKSARTTGRCLLLDQNQLPNEAGQASDLAVGLGVFNTAVLESAFAGVPFLTIDRGGKRISPYYQFGLKRIVFTKAIDALARIEELKNHPQELKEILSSTEISALFKQIDPFQDGKTSERISLYIKTLLDAFGQGKSKSEALALANSLKFYEKQNEKFVSI